MDVYFPGRMAEADLFKQKVGGGLSKSLSKSFVFRFAGLLVVFLLQILLARLMKPAHFGDFTIIVTVVNIFLTFSLFGFDSSASRFIPELLAKKDFASVQGFAKFSYRSVAFIALMCSVAILVFLIAKSKRFNIGFSEGLFWGLLLIPFLASIYQSSAILVAMGRIKTSMVPVYFITPVLMGLGCYYYFYSHQKLSVDAAMLINLFCTVAVSIFIKGRVKKVLNDVAPADKPSYDRKSWLSVSGILFMPMAIELLLKQSDILFVGYFLGNTQAGSYSVAVRLTMFTALGLAATNQVFLPKVVAMFESRQWMKMQQLIRNSTLQVLSITLPLAFIVLLGGKWILSLFGSSFSGAYLPLIILMAGQIINTSMGMAFGLLAIAGYRKTIFILYLLAFSIQIVLNLLLIPIMGITGAAIASTLSLLFLNITAYVFVRRKLKIKASFI